MTHVTLKSSTLGSYINHCMHVWFKLVIFMSDAREKRKQVDKKLSYKGKCTGSDSNGFCFEITDKIPSEQYSIDSLIIFNVHEFKSPCRTNQYLQ